MPELGRNWKSGQGCSLLAVPKSCHFSHLASGSLVPDTCGLFPSHLSKMATSRETTGCRATQQVIQPCPSGQQPHPILPAPGPCSGVMSGLSQGFLHRFIQQMEPASLVLISTLCDPGQVTISLWSPFPHLYNGARNNIYPIELCEG